MPLRVGYLGLKAMRVERQVLFWLSAALVLVLLIALLRGIILPFVAGIVIAYFMNPAADRLTQWGVPRGIAAAFIVAAFGCVIVIALIFLVPLLLTQAQQFAVALPDEITRLRALVETWAREQLGAHYPDFEAGLDRSSRDDRREHDRIGRLRRRLAVEPGACPVRFLLAHSRHAARRLLRAHRLAPDAGQDQIPGCRARTRRPSAVSPRK